MYKMENQSLKTLSLLKEANGALCPTKVRQAVKTLITFMNDIERTRCSEAINSSQFISEMDSFLFRALVAEFKGRDFTSYDKSDFKDYDILAAAALELAVETMSLCFTEKRQREHNYDMKNENQTDIPKFEQGSLCTDHKEIHDENDDSTIMFNHDNVLKLLPNLLLLIAGNIRKPIWSSEECQNLSTELLKHVTDLFECDIQNILIDKDFIQEDSQISKLRKKNYLSYFFHLMEKPLSRDRWEKNPFLSEVFCYLVVQVRLPNLSNHVDQVMATSLNFIHSHEAVNKINGLKTLKHLITNVSGEELRWYNRADVIYETLKNQMYSKDEGALDNVLQCLFLILKVLERSPLEKSGKHCEVLASMLRDAEMENLLVVRRILISKLAEFILDFGVLCIQYLSKILQVIETFLEIDDSTQETARIEALQALENVILVAWPRIPHHSQHILQFLLKLIINIETPAFTETKCLEVKEKLVSKVIICVKLLLKISPDLYSSLAEIEESQTLMMLKKFCKMILLEVDEET